MEDVKQIFAELGLPAELLPIALALWLLGKVGPGVGVAASWARNGSRWLRGLPGVGKKGAERRERRESHRLFAKDIAKLIDDLDKDEWWLANRFTELEAQIETHGDEHFASPILRFINWRPQVRRERSLTKALRRSTEDVILLLGHPGSGKSVALRRLAKELAAGSAKSRSVTTRIPIYVNLRRLERRGRKVDSALIESFVIESLAEHGNSTVDDFLKRELGANIGEATWLFLFDSFDEIPDILASTEEDRWVTDYSQAIEAFTRMRDCRTIVASRYFRAPDELKSQNWSIVPLSEKRKRKLIRRAGMTPDERRLLLKSLSTAKPGIAKLCNTPLFLSLVCDYVTAKSRMPDKSHDVFEVFVSHRLDDAAATMRRDHRLQQAEVREVAERIAYAMCDARGLGLSPRRRRVLEVLDATGQPDRDIVTGAMNVLVAVRLARGQPGPSSATAQVFEFVHRRFAEYFATCVVLEHPDRVPPYQLMLDGRWRETAVTLIELQPERAGALIDAAQQLLERTAAGLPEIDDERLAVIERGELGPPAADAPRFEWSAGVLHVLELLQAGYSGRDDDMPEPLRRASGRILLAAVEHGRPHDRYWALDVASTAESRVFAGLLRVAFLGKSGLLKEPAYEQVANFQEVPDDIARAIRDGLVRKTLDGTLRKDALTVKAQLMRIRDNRRLRYALTMLRATWWVDIVVHGVVFVWLVRLTDEASNHRELAILAFLLVTASWAAPSLIIYRSAVPALVVRVCCAFAAGVAIPWFGLAEGAVIDVSIVSAVAVLLALTWVQAAFVTVVDGRLLNPLTWPLAHVTMLLLLFTRNGLEAAGLLVGAIVVFGGGTFGLIALLEAVLSDSVLAVVIIVLGGGWALMMVGFGAVAAVSWARELMWYLDWRTSLPPKVRAEQVLHWLDARRSAQGARLVLGDIAKERRLAADPDAYAVMADLELATDRAVRLIFPPPPSSLWRSEIFMRWYEAAPRGAKLRTFGHAFLDDVSRLVQELEPTASQAQAPPPPVELQRPEPPELPPAAESAG